MGNRGTMRDPAMSGPAAAREPIFNLPRVVMAVIAILVAVHLWRLVLPFESDLGILAEMAVVPARFALEFGWLDQGRIVQDALNGLDARQSAERMAVARYFLDGGGPRWWSLLSYGLLHSGTSHIVMNCLWLAIFGSPLARRLGPGGFLLLIVIGTVADDVVRGLPALSLAGLLVHRQTMIFVILWFVGNWLFGAGVVPLGDAEQSIAWEAHIGGFLAGLLLFPLLDRHGHQAQGRT
ncbi:MAG: rhomboid family intramembrane serine protease [Beijerinckiaceae bacterium]|nr:rhomboid family intramembrane serine protease [Beijerinckiaceae bacterium]